MKLFDHIDLAGKFAGQPPAVQESVNAAEHAKTSVALEMAKRMASVKKPEPESKSLGAMPIPN